MNPTSKPWSKRWPEASFNTALTAVAAALIGLAPPTAQALSLGPIVVQSALGEPLRAEIDVLEINAEEAASLRTTVASPEAFRAAGLDYNAAIANLRVTLQRRANGRSFIRLQSDRPVNDPFVDMILEANWSSGRIVRDYTMLFDPPNLRAAPAAVAQATAPAVQEAVATPAAPAARAPAAVAPRAAPRLARLQQLRLPKPTSRPPLAKARWSSSPATPPAKLHWRPNRPVCRWTKCWLPCCARTPTLLSTAT